MFIGHFALGFAAKRALPKRNLALLMVAPLLLDMIFPPLVLLGIERMHLEPGNTAIFPAVLDHIVWSHSVVMTVLWSALYAAFVFALTRDKRAALICAALVASHWVLDFVTHRPDMPLAPGVETKLGLGLWHSLPGTLVVELPIWAASLWLYYSSTVAKDRIGKVAPAVFIVLLTGSYFGSIFGPPPPSAEAFAAAGIGAMLLIPFIAWFDSHRMPKDVASR